MLDVTDHNGLLVKLGMGRVASTLGILPVTVRAWKARNRIPAEHWQSIIALAASEGLLVTAEWLLNRMPKRGAKEAA